ncbi:MAG TPA: glycine zipper 2TM domain-containing protein, partial [Alphaproteobacteria bacterium]|nr:glycine zipper 2TM domain-containing protein [Alphaproteobacteria bacterium]
MRWSKWAIVATAAIFLAACENQQYGAKESVGTLLGAAGGAVAGAQFGKGTGRLAAVAAGTMLGAWLGNEVGKSLDRADKLAMQRSTQTALESTPSG